jgi:hypothetical protein
MNLYAAFLAATIGADDFDTRERWADALKGGPLAVLAVPALWDDDPEVAFRARAVTGLDGMPRWFRTGLGWKAAAALTGEPVECDAEARWWGDRRHEERADTLQAVARELGLVDETATLMWGTEAMRRWLYWCRCVHRGDAPAGLPGDPLYFDIPVPQQMPREKP